MAFSEFSIVVPSLLIISVKHIDEYSASLNIPAFISIPYKFQGPFEFTPNISYIRSPLSGQVVQRLFAVNHVHSTYILAMDDDIYIPIQQLSDLFSKYKLLIVSFEIPILGVQIVSRSNLVTTSRQLSAFALRLLSVVESTSVHQLLRPSSLSPLCFNTSHNSCFSDSNTSNVGCYRSDWISGGFFIAPRSVFPSENYYPFQGKAFAEDLILSFLFKRAGSSLFIANSAVALTDDILPSYTIKNLRSKLYLLKFSSVSHRYIRFIFSLLIRWLSLTRII